jgi:tetratricopeptide (TPR) repeat protein
MPQIKKIHKEIDTFLGEALFARLYVHYVHYVSTRRLEEIGLCYQYIKQMTGSFDKEGYIHQEMPRLMLLPVIVPDKQVESVPLINLLDELKNSFFLSSLYLDKTTFVLAQSEKVLAGTEKIYLSPCNSRKLPDIAGNLFCQDLLDDSLDMLSSEAIHLSDQCGPCLFVSTQDGNIYSCIDSFQKGEKLANMYEDFNVEELMSRGNRDRLIDRSKRNCLGCREKTAESFADLPMSQDTKQRIGALLCHFGTLLQDAQDYLQAVEKYKKSLELSPVEEAGHIYFRLAICYTMTGFYDQALKAFNSSELMYNNQYYFHFYKGLCCFEMGDYQAALSEFSRAQHLKPQQEDLVRILIYAGSCHNSLGEYEDAVVVLERAGKIAGHVKEIYNALGFSYFQLKNYDKAIENLRMAVKIDPCSAVDYASLGSNYREKGDFDMAVVMYEKALTLDPDMILARENLERLKKRA